MHLDLPVTFIIVYIRMEWNGMNTIACAKGLHHVCTEALTTYKIEIT